MLAERELYVANFYLGQKQYHAALLRLEGLRGNTDFGDLRAEAAYKLGYAYLKLDDQSKARELFSEVMKNPEAGHYRGEAEKFLNKTKPM